MTPSTTSNSEMPCPSGGGTVSTKTTRAIALGPRVGGAPRDVAPAAMADDHDLPLDGIDLGHDRVDPVGDADVRRLGRGRADSRQGQGVDGMARSLERGSHVVP